MSAWIEHAAPPRDGRWIWVKGRHLPPEGVRLRWIRGDEAGADLSLAHAVGWFDERGRLGVFEKITHWREDAQ